ncbi:hypothetical protein KSP40_PGU022347 [Platanthera guangdongensis]|uniref:Uncharacterized protein n=1 Tax=Platanthera guangdongensis TaxID=2320717 RepID=A0ABR2LFF6_9ASPA
MTSMPMMRLLDSSMLNFVVEVSSTKTLREIGLMGSSPIKKIPTATANKEQSTGSNILANTGIKGGAKKPGKVGGKDVKQGNIMSFFKKV